ncbi:hypothetical protein BT69DRAFT_895001 [Atractiella rhizophila]|nr:hypothetical protein BT69DRAFT_895001 [Atractiella rhizophila]
MSLRSEFAFHWPTDAEHSRIVALVPSSPPRATRQRTGGQLDPVFRWCKSIFILLIGFPYLPIAKEPRDKILAVESIPHAVRNFYALDGCRIFESCEELVGNEV